MKKIIMHFTEAKDYKLIPVTGAWGGLSPNGEIIIDFYVEKLESPEVVNLEIQDTGKAEEISREGEKYVRIKQFGIVMRPDIAINIGQFLLDKAKPVIQKKKVH